MKKHNESPLARFNRRYLSEETGIGLYTLGRIIRGEREATKTELIALSKVTGLDQDTLSPVVENKEERTA